MQTLFVEYIINQFLLTRFKRTVMNWADILNSFHQNSCVLRNDRPPSKMRLFQYYVVLWIYVIDAIFNLIKKRISVKIEPYF